MLWLFAEGRCRHRVHAHICFYGDQIIVDNRHLQFIVKLPPPKSSHEMIIKSQPQNCSAQETFPRLPRLLPAHGGGEGEFFSDYDDKLDILNVTCSCTAPLMYTMKCRFMNKGVREISRFFVAPPRVFPLSVWRISRTSLSQNPLP